MPIMIETVIFETAAELKLSSLLSTETADYQLPFIAGYRSELNNSMMSLLRGILKKAPPSEPSI